MKAFIISISLTVALTAAVLINALYVSKVTEEMKSLVEQIDQGQYSDKAFEALCDKWARHKRIFTVSVSFEDIDHITEYITRLGGALESGDADAVDQHCALLQNFFDDVTRHEKISLLNIL